MGDLLLTPANALLVADQLSQMRGAAMKMGQLLSMDAGELLPPELTAILSRLRADAHPMPGPQLKAVLAAAWGSDWLRRFARFDVRPIAAASIGQVHRALTRDGRDLAVKVQYPGIRRSIDSDVDNVAVLLRLSGLVPREIDLAPLLAEAKRQLHEEADYVREGACLVRFSAVMGEAPGFVLPELQPDLTTSSVLAMTYVEGRSVEDLADAPQDLRDSVVSRLIGLMFRELFEFGLMQTDPNFANYRHQASTDRIVLLDFGATRELPAALASDYAVLMRAGLAGNHADLRAAMVRSGFLRADAPAHVEKALLRMIGLALEPLRQSQPFDFGASDMVQRMQAESRALSGDRAHMAVPPIDALYIQRKFGGMYLLASRLGARVDLRALLDPHLWP